MTPRLLILHIATSTSLSAADWKAPQPPRIVDTAAFKVPEGLEVTVWAKSPQLYNPTNMDIDASGRIWVAEGVNYRRHNGRRPGGDRIAVLQDTNGDGKADSSHTFVQEKGLIAPLGVAVFDNRVVVSQPPDLIVYTDVDRDLRFDPAVDKREVLLTGFNARNHDHSLHSVTGGPDGKWYFNNGNCGAIFTDNSGKKFTIYGEYRGGGGEWFADSHKELNKVSDDGFKWTSGFSARMNPDGTEVEIIGHGYRNSYEHAVNSFGELFQNDNDDPPACRNSYVLEFGSAGYFTREGYSYRTVKRPGQDHGRAHWRQDDPGTFDVGDIYGGGSPTGVVFYENGALGENARGTFLSCEAGKNVIFSYQPEVKGAGYKMDRHDWMNSNPDGEFVGSDFVGGSRKLPKAHKNGGDVDPKLFRPSDVAVGADGAIYVADWFDPRVGGHADLDASCSGAIYRIAPKGFKPNNPKVDLSTVEGAITALRSPAPNVRWTGFNALKAKGPDALDAVLSLRSDPNPWIAARAIWLLPYLGENGVSACNSIFGEAHGNGNSLVAFRALKRAGIDILPLATKLASTNPIQRAQGSPYIGGITTTPPALLRDVALSMRGRPPEVSAPILIEVAKQWDGNDKNYLEAIGLGAENHEAEIWTAMRDALAPGDPLEWSDSFTKLTWRLWPTTAIDSLKKRASSLSLAKEQRDFAVESLSFINDEVSADSMFELVTSDSPSKAAATRWLLMRGSGAWAHLDLKKRLMETGIYDPSKIDLSAAPMPKPPKSASFSEKDVLNLKGDATKGKQISARCIMCHHIDGIGPHYGPDLKGWVARQGEAMAVRAIVNPAADIAHGFEGVRVLLKDGKKIDGLRLASGDPVIIQSTGGLTQMIPASRIKKQVRMKQSLMLNADQLGVKAQDVADLVEYLKSY